MKGHAMNIAQQYFFFLQFYTSLVGKFSKLKLAPCNFYSKRVKSMLSNKEEKEKEMCMNKTCRSLTDLWFCLTVKVRNEKPLRFKAFFIYYYLKNINDIFVYFARYEWYFKSY